MTETIALGGLRLHIRPLKLGQLRHLLDALDEMAGKSGGGLIEAAAKVVAAGVAPGHPDMTADRVLDIEAGVDDLNAAVAAILRIAGLRPPETAPKESALGEAWSPDGRPPGAAVPGMASPGAGGTSSAPSTALSPPAAPIPIPSSTT